MVENKAKHIAAYSLLLELDGKSNKRAVSATSVPQWESVRPFDCGGLDCSSNGLSPHATMRGMNRRDPRIQKTALLVCLVAATLSMGMAIGQLDSGIRGSGPVVMGVLSSVAVVLALTVLLRDVWKRNA